MLNSAHKITEHFKTHFNTYLSQVMEEEQEKDVSIVKDFKVKSFETLDDGYISPSMLIWCIERRTEGFYTVERINVAIVHNGEDSDRLSYENNFYMDALERCVRGDRSFSDSILYPGEFDFNSYVIGGVSVVLCMFDAYTEHDEWEG